MMEIADVSGIEGSLPLIPRLGFAAPLDISLEYGPPLSSDILKLRFPCFILRRLDSDAVFLSIALCPLIGLPLVGTLLEFWPWSISLLFSHFPKEFKLFGVAGTNFRLLIEAAASFLFLTNSCKCRFTSGLAIAL